MDRRVNILDCTLRDGGFVNNWLFGKDCINDIVNNLNLSKVDIIEIGYLRDHAKKSIHTTEFSEMSEINEVIDDMNLSSKLVAIIDYGMFSIDSVIDSIKAPLYGLRVTFKKHEMDDALGYCGKLKEKGYRVFVQPVSFTEYSNSEILQLVGKINNLNPFSVALVDTYGFMFRSDVLRYFRIMDENLNDGIALGYHGHNNYQLASSNAMSIMEELSKRTIIIDSSMYGMGKGAGNAHTELLMNYCNKFLDASYQITNVMEMIDNYIKPIKDRKKWGYNLSYFMNASLKVHPSYVKYLLDKKTLTIDHAIQILQNIKLNNKTQFNELDITSLYNDHSKRKLIKANQERLPIEEGENFLVIGPGSNLEGNMSPIKSFLEDGKYNVIATNFIPKEIVIDYLFVTNNKRYTQLETKLRGSKKVPFMVVCTDDVKQSELSPDIIVKSYNIGSDSGAIHNNSLVTVLRLLVEHKPRSVHLAGFDGFSEDGGNYYNPGMELKTKYGDINTVISNQIEIISKEFNIEFVTPSLYERKV